MITQRLTLAFLLFVAAVVAPPPSRRPPNVVIILVDDLGYGDLPVYGNQVFQTPNIDQLAAEGMRFTSWYTAAAICTPSRSALMTGRLPIRYGLADDIYQVFLSANQVGGLPTSEITIAEGLKQAGYVTGMVGKWHLGVNEANRTDQLYLPRNHGFDSATLVAALGNGAACDVTLDPPNPNEPFFCFYMRQENVTQMPWELADTPQKFRREFSDFLTTYVTSSTPRKPYFWFHSMLHVHTPLFASPPFDGSNPGNRYADNIEEHDYEVGLIMNLIRNTDPNTIVFYLSDNGAFLEDFVFQDVDQTSSAPFKGGKGTTWEGGFRVPAIAWWPGRIPAGRVQRGVANSMDLFPTIMALAGVPLPTDRIIDGKDISNLLLRPQTQSPWHNNIMPYFCGTQLNAVRWNQYKIAYTTQLFVDFDGNPTSPDQCHGECCPGEPGTTGACGCNDNLVVIDGANFVIIPQTRTAPHNPPWIYDLLCDVHEKKPLTPDNFPQYNSILRKVDPKVQQLKNSYTPLVPTPLNPPVRSNDLQPLCRSQDTGDFFAGNCDYEEPCC